MRKPSIAVVSAAAVVSLLLGMPAVALADDPAAVSDTLAEKVAEAGDAGRTSPEELADAAGLPVDGPGSLVLPAEGIVSATVSFASAPTGAQLERVRQLAEITRVYDVAPAVAVRVAPSQLDDLGAIDGVVSAAPDLRPSTSTDVSGLAAALPAPAVVAGDPCRAFPADADAPQQADTARADFGVDGTGVTVGILSDSYMNRTDQAGIDATEIATGLLPGPGNPCGYETPVEVVADYVPAPDANPGTDEGRAMAELVHGIAPGARLMFHTAQGNGATGFAQAILDLAIRGADVIVDDIGYGSETYYQQNIISWAIERVRAQGVAYYTSAGNHNANSALDVSSDRKPLASWSTPQFRATPCPDWVDAPDEFAEYDCLNWDGDGGAAASDTLSLSFSELRYAPRLILSWGEPIGGVAARLDLQFYRDGATPAFASSSGRVDEVTPNALLALPQGSTSGDYRLVLVRDRTGGADVTPAVWIGTLGSAAGIVSREHDVSVGVDVVGPSTYGHAADGSAVSVAAAPWNSPYTVEPFSSIGPGTLLFEPFDPSSPEPAAPLPAPVTVAEPSITGVDGVRTSFFSAWENSVWRFYGTSAAAPNVAAVHALAAQYAPGRSADAVLGTMLETAVPLYNPYPSFPAAHVYGAGLVDAHALLAALPAPAPASVSATAPSATSVAAAWTAVAGASGYAVDLLHGDAVVTSVSEAAGATTTTFADVRPDDEYRVRVSALNGRDQPGAATTSDAVRTPIPPTPGTTPPAPAESSLDAAHQGGLAVEGATTVRPGDTVTVSGLPQRAWVFGWAFSTPAPLGWAWTGPAGTAQFTVPTSLAAGTHRIAVTDPSGVLLGWVEVQVTVPALAATGLGVDPVPLGLAAGAALLGGLLLILRRRPLAGRR
jgi:hypothetical protein